MKNVILLVLLLLAGVAYGQSGEIDQGSDWKDRIYAGGGFGLQFGTITNIEVSPLIGYRITENFSAGLGVTYIYYKIDLDPPRDDFETNIYGGRVFARRNITDQFFLHGEFESLNLEFFNVNDGTINREWVPGLFIGGGYFMPLGRNAGFSAMALYNVIHDDLKSPYNSPLVIRIGITAGF